MKISKFKKYICWNLISLLGYFGSVIMIIFIILYTLSASQLHMKAELDEIYAEYIVHHIIKPYLSFYQTQIGLIVMLLIGSYFENKHYIKQEIYGLRLFENSNKLYSIAFVSGLILNLCPLYIVSTFWISRILSYIQTAG